MKAFTFRFEKVLQLRKFHEEEAKVELGRAIGELSDLEAKIYVLAQERARAHAAQFDPANSAAIMQQYMFYLLRLDGLKEHLFNEAATAEMKVEQAREAFVEASKERKIMDKLKEKRQFEYKKNMLSIESQELDEISASTQIRLGRTA